MAFNGSRVVVGAGTLYAAPLGTTEPTSVTGAWTGWTSLGYTDTGSTFDITPKVSPVEVEEEYWPIRQAITSYEGSITFALAEATAQNLLLSLNAGFPIRPRRPAVVVLPRQVPRTRRVSTPTPRCG